MKSKHITKLLAILAFVTISGQISAQNRISSPYSRFGIGDLLSNNGVFNMAMGGISYGVYSPYFVNNSNPASYVAFDSLSFIFDVGAFAKLSTLSNQNISQKANFASLGNLKFGFPVTKWWKSSFGLQPYSMTGYSMLDSQVDANQGNVNFLYEGDGGISQFYFGNSYSLTRNLSVGFNLSYLFGTLNKSSRSEFPDSLLKLNYNVLNSAKVHDVYLDYGLFFHKQLASGLQYNAGLVFSTNSNISATENRLGYTYFIGSTGVELIRDTVLNEPEVKGNILLPANAGFGFSLGKTDKWMAGADIQWQQWEKFKYFGVSDSLKNSLRISVGGSYTPSITTVSGYWQRITYRAGLKYSSSYLELRGKNIDEFGISLGVGLPLPRTRSTINLAAEFGTRGTTSNNLIKDNYVKFTLGLSIFERWFIIRKYD
ncbi:MAG: hypothetical protein H6541_10025 [Lentimicrobiaceae bacterium]|nr:hypothetical protein [Lentimicrobiaceae bacterium]MCO5266828.1 outer membrane protein transport protein [Lentimicrobium sp.]